MSAYAARTDAVATSPKKPVVGGGGLCRRHFRYRGREQIGYEPAMNRTSFISSIGAAASVAFLRDVALAEAPNNPYSLTPLVETILPVMDPGFPVVTGQTIAERIESLYHLSDSRTFAGSLSAFMQPSFFPEPLGLLYDVERSSAPDADVHEAASADRERYRRASLPIENNFAAFTPDQRAAYVRLWSQSAFNTRRRFYQSARFLTFAAFYSLPQVWPAIKYSGPVLQAEH